MGLLHLLIAALAATAALAADSCQCVNKDQKINTISSPMIFFQQPTLGGQLNGPTCSMNCTFTASLDQDDPDYALQVQLLTNSLGDGKLSIDGLNDTVTIFSTTPAQLFPSLSYGDSITIDFTEGTTNNGEFMIVVMKVKGPRPSKPSTKPPVTFAPTVDYNHIFHHNPLLVANDIMLAFDLSSGDIEKYKTFARNLIKELTIVPKSLTYAEGEIEDCGVGSRLSVVGLSALSGFNNLYAPYWTTSYVQADGNIGSFVQIGGGKFFMQPVQDDYVYGFGNKSATQVYTACENRGKIFILLTSSAPVEYKGKQPDNGNPPIIGFLEKGVHQILVQYNMPEDDKKYYNDLYEKPHNVWNTFDLAGTDKDIENFFNQYLVDTSDKMTCQTSSADSDIVIDDTFSSKDVNIPPYYDAKTSTPGRNWATLRHYCNFQDTTITFSRNVSSKNPIPLCLTVYYDLETGQDFVRILSGNPKDPSNQKEVVRLTGRDISGTNFDLDDAYGSIVFSSDEKNVYDGVHVEIKTGQCP